MNAAARAKYARKKSFKEYYTIMRKFSFVAASLIFAAMFAVSVSAQTAAAQPGSARIAMIDSGAFGAEKEGITRYVSAVKQLGTELKPLETELVSMQKKMQDLADQIAKLQATPAGVPIPQKDILDKQDEGQRLQREFEFKKKEYDARVEKRGSELLAPIQQDIGKAIQDYAIQKGFTLVLDIDKLGREGSLLAMDPKAEITKEFIAFFNARPATASTGTPK
jgi:Skp family chaperone for outer membrane proteins